MLEFERNISLDTAVLSEFFARCGWQETEPEVKLHWVLAASEEWVVCRLDGELIGFGRSCRLGPMNRVVFDVLVDTRFRASGLRHEIVRLLSEHAGGLEQVSVFTEHEARPLGALPAVREDPDPGHLPVAPPGAYLGRRRGSSEAKPTVDRDPGEELEEQR
jgi:hypothetical protein